MRVTDGSVRGRLKGRRSGSRPAPARTAPLRTAPRAQLGVARWRDARTPAATGDLASAAGTGKLRRRPPLLRRAWRRPGCSRGRRSGFAPGTTTAQRCGTTTPNGLRPRARRPATKTRDRPKPHGPIAGVSSRREAWLEAPRRLSLRNRPVRHGAHHARAAARCRLSGAQPAAASALSGCPPHRDAIPPPGMTAAQKWTHPITLICRTHRGLSSAAR
jgi:hypothetical protein